MRRANGFKRRSFDWSEGGRSVGTCGGAQKAEGRKSRDTASLTYRCFLPDLTRFVSVCCAGSGPNAPCEGVSAAEPPREIRISMGSIIDQNETEFKR